MNTYLIAYRFANADELLGPRAVQWATVTAEDATHARLLFGDQLLELYTLEFIEHNLRLLSITATTI